MIREYRNSDKEELLQLLDRNIPDYFDPAERNDYIDYLNDELEDYFVYEVEGRLLAAAGINYNEDEARLSWDFVHPDIQGQGIGRAITQHRIRHIKNKGYEKIRVRTSQHAYKFYEKMGFQISRVEENYWAENYHLYDMNYVSNA